jgi:DNA-binding NtrC family response regulator
MKVLMVEDDSAMAQMCAKLLRRRGHTIHVAGTAEEALIIMEDQRDLDVVVSDVHMPRMSGIQLLQRIRAIDNSIPFILMTGYTHIVNASQAIALGAADYIVKPFDPEVFIHCLERVLRVPANFPYTRAE